MKNHHLFLCIAILNLITIGSIFGQGNSTTELEKEKILKVEKDFCKAKTENNVKMLENILADNYQGTNHGGKKRNKPETLELFKTFKNNLTLSDGIRIELKGENSATATGVQIENGLKIDFVHEYIKKDGNWLILSNVQKTSSTAIESQKGLGYYRISGKLKNGNNLSISLIRNNNGRNENIAAAIIVDDKFEMKGQPIGYPQRVNLTIPGKLQKWFFLENAEIIISGDLDSIASISIKGSKTQDDYEQLIKEIEPRFKQMRENMKELQKAASDKDTVKMDLLKKQNREIEIELTELQKGFILKNPNSFLIPEILNGLSRTLTAVEVEDLMKKISPDVAKTPELTVLSTKLEELKKVDIGQKAPDFTLNDPDGKPVSLSSKVSSKLLLIDFWAGWCGPCRRENPNLVKVYNEFHSKGFDILGVSLDRTREEWIKAIESDKLTWTYVSDLLYFNSEAAKKYVVSAIPANFLVDKNGIIVAKNLRGEELYNKIKELID